MASTLPIFRIGMSVKIWLLILVIFSMLSLSHNAEMLQAIAFVRSANGQVSGNITFSESDAGMVSIFGKVKGLKPGPHGFHIHETGDIRSCGWTGAHYNPFRKSHGGILSAERHVGDLGNIECQPDGVTIISLSDSIISLRGVYSILGRSVVITAEADDLGEGGYPDSYTTGHSGNRICCGVIGLLTRIDKINENPFNDASIGRPDPLISLLATLVIIRLHY